MSRTEPESKADGRDRVSAAGFTLLEMIVVVAVIGTLAAVVGPALFRNVGDANVGAARSQVEMLGLALEAYRLDNHAYPSTEQGLEALVSPPESGPAPANWRGPYLRRAVPLDPWGRPFDYQAPGVLGGLGFDLYTMGRDGAPGGIDEDADVTSWGLPLDSSLVDWATSPGRR